MQWIEFNENNLIEFQKKLNWKGSGTKDDPIIIESLEGLKELLRFKNIRSFIVVRNISLSELKIRYSENITIQNCNIYYFWIEFCHDILVEGSSIVHFNVEFCKNNIFRDNNLHEGSGFSASTLRTKGEEGSNLYFIVLSVSLCFLGGGIIFFLIYGLFSKNVIGLFASIYFLICSGISSIPVILIKRKRSFIKRFPPNNFENNSITDLGDLDRNYSAIYDI